MELRPWLLWVIAAAGPLVLLVADAQGQQVFTNTWAVHISGGPAVADRLARKHGFLNQGQVGSYRLPACAEGLPGGWAGEGRGPGTGRELWGLSSQGHVPSGQGTRAVLALSLGF